MDMETICGVCWFTFPSRCSARCLRLLGCFLLVSIIHGLYDCHDGGMIREHLQKPPPTSFPGPQQARKHLHLPHAKHRRKGEDRPLLFLPHCHWLLRDPEAHIYAQHVVSMLSVDVSMLSACWWHTQIPVTEGKGRSLEEETLAATTWPCNSGASGLTSVGFAYTIHREREVRNWWQNLRDAILLWMHCPHHWDATDQWGCCCWVTGSSHLISLPEHLHHTSHGAKAYPA